MFVLASPYLGISIGEFLAKKSLHVSANWEKSQYYVLESDMDTGEGLGTFFLRWVSEIGFFRAFGSQITTLFLDESVEQLSGCFL